jgi:serine phosphatase RsbU (regulator of sigma subunit)
MGDQLAIAIALSNLGLLLLDLGNYAEARATLEECLALDKRLGDTLGIATVSASLGRLALAQGDYARAHDLLSESLRQSRDLAAGEAIADGLESLAAVAVAPGQAARAVHMLGAAEALRETIGAPLVPTARAAHEQTLALAGAQLDPATMALTWASGRAGSIDQALGLAPEANLACPPNGEMAALTEEFNRMAGRVAELVRQQHAEAQTRERIEHELRLARMIQQSLLPRSLPTLPGWQIAAHYRPARAVGGDYYDCLLLPDGRLGLAIGDVTDKGVPAALVMASTRSILRGIAEHGAAPAEVLERTNDLLCQDIPAKMFVTCFYAIVDLGSGHVRFANAGHVLPLWRHASGVSELHASGMPLGALPGMRYQEGEITLAPGESLLFHSDGVAEARNMARELFGFERLHELVGQRPAADALLIGALLHELERFVGTGAEQEDDVTLVTLGRCPTT